MNRDTCVIIPAYNEGPQVRDTILEVMKRFSHVVCVNDGSRDDTAAQIQKTKAFLVSHPINMGQGAALQTGIDFALQFPKIKYFVTFDADGQHGLADVEKMLAYLRKHPETDIVLGSRFLGTAQNISKTKKLILKLAVLFSNFTTGLKLSDAHNGLRGFNRHVAENLEITMPDMAHASEIIHRIADKKFKYQEMPITVTYTDYSMEKGQPLMNAVNISFDILLHRMSKK